MNIAPFIAGWLCQQFCLFLFLFIWLVQNIQDYRYSAVSGHYVTGESTCTEDSFILLCGNLRNMFNFYML